MIGSASGKGRSIVFINLYKKQTLPNGNWRRVFLGLVFKNRVQLGFGLSKNKQRYILLKARVQYFFGNVCCYKYFQEVFWRVNIELLRNSMIEDRERNTPFSRILGF